MTTILLARHGETDWNREGRFQGYADPALNDTGRAQAADLAAELTDVELTAVYSSPLRRAFETAELLAAPHRLTPVPVEALRGIDALGRELRAQGYNMGLGGGVNLTREPRNGRTFEYMGEDPILAGKMVASAIKGLQEQHVIGDIKHYALNDQESGRNAVNVNIGERAMRETDLLAFEIGIWAPCSGDI